MQVKKGKKLQIIKISLDVFMLACLILLMCEHTLTGLAHEILGIVIFLAFIIHNILNYRWHKILLTGKANKRMIPFIVINSLIFVALIMTMISAMMVSGYLFKDLFTNSRMLGRGIHMVSSMWLFIFVSVHFGFHLNMMVGKIKDSLIFKIVEAILILLGLFVFIYFDRGYEEMFYLTNFKNYDEQLLIVDILKKISVVLSISLLSFDLNDLLRRKNKK